MYAIRSYYGGMSGVEQDVIPYGMVIGDRARLNGLNVIGLKRRGFTRDEIKSLRGAYRITSYNVCYTKLLR